MRISLIGPTHPFRGGIAHHTTLLCRVLREQHDVQFISFKRMYPHWLFPGKTDRDNSAEGLRVENVEHLIDCYDPLAALRVARRIGAYQPELLIIPWWVVFWAPLFNGIVRRVQKKTKARVIFLCHNVREHEGGLLKSTMTRRVLRRADEVFTHSNQETERLRELLGDGACITTAFHPTYSAVGRRVGRGEARARLRLQGNVLLFFGFVRPYKGLDVLLRALPSVIDREPVTLLVVGEFWKGREETNALIRDLGLGDVVRVIDRYVPDEEVGEFFAAADLVVQPYRRASGSGVCQLAYGHDTPVVATRTGSLADVIEDRVNGRLVEPEDEASLADAIVESLEPETLKNLNAEARKTKERFSWPRLVDMLIRAESV